MSRFDMISIGHLSKDELVIDGKFFECLGGSVAYSSITASKMGFRVGIISKIGYDFNESYLRLLTRYNVDLSMVRRVPVKSTSFRNVYRGGFRRQYLLALCRKITVRDVDLSRFRSKVYYFGPIYKEVSINLLEKVASMEGKCVLDVQGYCRSRGLDGLIHLVRWKQLKKALRSVWIFKASLEEARCLVKSRDLVEICVDLRSMGPEIVLITMGAEGAVCHAFEETLFSPSIKARVVDPTGAGDVFLASFTMSYLSSNDLIDSLAYAVAASSFTVEKYGVSGIPDRRMVLSRVNHVKPSIRRIREGEVLIK